MPACSLCRLPSLDPSPSPLPLTRSLPLCLSSSLCHSIPVSGLQDVSITHLVFSREFTQAIEAKQVAQQEAERSKFIVAKAEQEQKAAIIKAEGESEAATLISNALRTSGTAMLDIRRLEASREIADTLSQARNVVYVPNSGNMLMAMPAAGAGRGAASLA